MSEGVKLLKLSKADINRILWRQTTALELFRKTADVAHVLPTLRSDEPLLTELRTALADFLEGKLRPPKGRRPKRLKLTLEGTTTNDPAYWANIRRELDRRVKAGERREDVIEDIAREHRLKGKTVANRLYSKPVKEFYEAEASDPE